MREETLCNCEVCRVGRFVEEQLKPRVIPIEEHSMICKCPECKAADKAARRLADSVMRMVEPKLNPGPKQETIEVFKFTDEVLKLLEAKLGVKFENPYLRPEFNTTLEFMDRKSVSDSERGPTSGFGFEVALNHLKAGRKVRRKGQKYLTLISRTDGSKRLLVEGYDSPTDSVNVNSAMAQDWELVMPLELNKLEPMKKAEEYVNFEKALQHMKKGGRVRRNAWMDMFRFIRLNEQGISLDVRDGAHYRYTMPAEDYRANDWIIS